ncbi:hypothetical protein BDQ17DRAFT_1391785 [Cyathus striatus]|nr:hypothetical protein BDQ17DRAFT_1391785 [Cyathus striatus]
MIIGPQRKQSLLTSNGSDGQIRILYSGILIESQDGEEASYFCACRAANAIHPCPKCLAHKDELQNITKSFELQTSDSMSAALQHASRVPSKAAKEKILQEHGLHNIKHFLWDFQFSDPYVASSYDILHSNDLGKWGKHLWPLLLEIFEKTIRNRSLSKLSLNMNKFLCWRSLKHIKNVANVSFTNGQCYYDILKKVSKEYGKNFNFFKQHYISHIIWDIQKKETTDNMSTCPGEGFQQESAEAYKQTNKKGADRQVSTYCNVLLNKYTLN